MALAAAPAPVQQLWLDAETCYRIKLAFTTSPNGAGSRDVVFESERVDLDASVPKSHRFKWFVFRMLNNTPHLKALVFLSQEGAVRTFEDGTVLRLENDGAEAHFSFPPEKHMTLIREKEPSTPLTGRFERALRSQLRDYFIKLLETERGITTWTRKPSSVFSFETQDGTVVFVAVFEKNVFRADQPKCYFAGSSLQALEFGSEFSHGMWGSANYSTFQNKVTFFEEYMQPIDTVCWVDGIDYKVKDHLKREPLTVPRVDSFPHYEASCASSGLDSYAKIAALLATGVISVGDAIKHK